ncbi:MAG: hypothetical protein IJD57_04985 [Candidatus Gastranaerophilales bacterium]|nr:hypothetical protein [Candidatus Gastranaerophilales bacterium]
MKITFNPYIKNNYKYPIFRSQTPQKPTLQEKDIFISSAKTLEQAKNEEKYLALFDDVYDEVVEQNTDEYCPDMQKVKLNKPTMKFVEKAPVENAEGAYSPLDNSIEIPRYVIDEDYYSYFVKSETDDDSFYADALRKGRFDEKIKYYQENHPNGQIIEFTDKEKELYLSGLMAHEIRHFLQKHLIASTKGIGKKAKKIWVKKSDKIITNLKNLELMKAWRAQLKGEEYEIQRYGEPYFKTYEPDEPLKKDAKIRFSLYADDERYISAKEFLKSEIYTQKNKQKMQENGVNYAYFANLQEIDAYNYGFEYLLSKMLTEAKNVRIDMLPTASYWQKQQSDMGLEYLQKRGYDPFVREKNR